jgi:hypothetical protein
MMARFERHRQWRAWLEWRGRDGDNIEVGDRCGGDLVEIRPARMTEHEVGWYGLNDDLMM